MATDRERLLHKVFHDYYVRNMSQNEIAERHFVSRQKVQRILKDGRDNNLVEIRVKFPDRIHGELESELEDKYGLLEAIVVGVDPEDVDNPALVLRDVSDLASEYFLRILSNDMIVSFTWSNHVAEMIDAASRKIAILREKPKNTKIVLTIGSVVGNDTDLQTLESSRRLASSLGGELHMLLAAGITASPIAQQALLDDPRVADVMELARRSQVAFFGVGSMDGASKCLRTIERVMPELIPEFRKRGIVGDINGHFFDPDGRQVPSELDRRLIGLSMDDIRALPLSVGIAAGSNKYEALRAVLRGGLLKVAITDVGNARRLVDER